VEVVEDVDAEAVAVDEVVEDPEEAVEHLVEVEVE